MPLELLRIECSSLACMLVSKLMHDGAGCVCQQWSVDDALIMIVDKL